MSFEQKDHLGYNTSVMKNKGFDCVQMVREIRDNIYLEHKKKGIGITSQILSQEASQTDLWKRLHKK